MEKAVGYLAKAVAATAAIGFLLAVVIMIDARTALSLPLFILSVASGAYAFRVWAGHSREFRLASTANAPRVLINS
ncbi:MAG TPA: hypothetical protein VM848_00420 [Acidimicrobiia bacterium]|nr:hypothetical protein [Acidimicrobiia bacterium]